jgi:hypothetical protein
MLFQLTGGTPGVVACSGVSLAELVEKLPAGTHVLGDGACTPMEHVVVPLSGDDRSDNANDVFDFFLSQLRVGIEMEFGPLTAKWCILRLPLEVGLKNVGKVVQICATLCSFHIQEDRVDVSDVSVEAVHGMVQAQSVENNELGCLEQQIPVEVISQPGSSALQGERICQVAADNKRERPRENIEHREWEQAHCGCEDFGDWWASLVLLCCAIGSTNNSQWNASVKLSLPFEFAAALSIVATE